MSDNYKLTTSEIFDLRKAIIEKFGLTQEGHDIWFNKILPALQLYETVKAWDHRLAGDVSHMIEKNKQLDEELVTK
jgi:hypothetical protein